jgi:hypothetical protein
MTPIQKLQAELLEMADFTEKEYLLTRVSRFIVEEQLVIMKAYGDGILALRTALVTDEIYDSYSEYYNKNFNECSQPSL